MAHLYDNASDYYSDGGYDGTPIIPLLVPVVRLPCTRASDLDIGYNADLNFDAVAMKTKDE